MEGHKFKEMKSFGDSFEFTHCHSHKPMMAVDNSNPVRYLHNIWKLAESVVFLYSN